MVSMLLDNQKESAVLTFQQDSDFRVIDLLSLNL